jgi:hypothetical protein
MKINKKYVGVLISLWLFLFAAQPKYFLLDGLTKLEQRSHKCVELMGICKYIFSIPQLDVLFIKPKTYQPPSCHCTAFI